MDTENFDKLVKKALMLDAKELPQFFKDIQDGEIRKKVEYLLKEDTHATEFIIKTSSGLKPLNTIKFKEFKAGDKIKQFIIVKLIAKGGMGSVYLAYDDKLKRNVAIKTIRSEFVNSETSKKRFQQEAQILSQINHPNICQIYDYIDYEDGELLVLELIDGETLNNFDYSNEQLLDIFIQISSALQVAHAKDVIHRDLKPDNIMLTTDNNVKILDFGIAKSKVRNFETASKNFIPDRKKLETPNITQAGSIMGTLIYMSPEQASQKGITSASDMYSLGVLIHLFLTKKTLYELEDIEDLHRKVIDAELEIDNALPKSYESLIKSLTAKDPKQRPSAEETEKQLVAIKNLPKEKKRKRRNVIVFIVALLLVCLLISQWVINYKSKAKVNFINKTSHSLNDIEIELKNIYGLPIHDVTADRQKLNRKRDETISQIKNSKVVDDGEKHTLIGKVYLANENYKLAEQEFLKAWKLEGESQELAKYLSKTYSFLYNLTTRESERNTGSELSEKYKETLDKYLQSLIKYFELSSKEYQNSNSIPNALISWHNKNHEKATKILGEIIDSQDWSFEAYTLKGFFVAKLAGRRFKDGNRKDANKLFNEAKNIYLSAINRGRSFENAYGGLCYVELAKVVVAYEATGESNMDADYKLGIEICKKYLKLTEDKVFAFDRLSQIELYYGNFAINNVEDAKKAYENAIKWNSKSIKLEKGFRAYDTRANLFASIAELKQQSGEDPSQDIDQAIVNMQKSLAFNNNRDYYIYASMIYVKLVQMNYQLYAGINPIENLNQSILYFNKGMNVKGIENDGKIYLYINLGNAWNLYINYQIDHNEITNDSLSEVKNLMNKLIALNPNEPKSYINLAETYYRQARALNINKKPSLNVTKTALENINKAQELIQPGALSLNFKAAILRENEIAKMRAIQGYQVDFSNSIDFSNKSILANPQAAISFDELALTYLNQAKYTAKVKASLELGLKACKKSHESNKNYPYSYVTHAHLIEYGIQQGVFSKDQQTKADELYQKAQSINSLLVKKGDKF